MSAGKTPAQTVRAPTAAGHSAFIPLLLLALTLAGWTSYQTAQLVSGRNSLKEAITGQDAQMEQSKKVRAALESLATGTARLAQAGNANATVIVEELRRRGISINTDTPLQAPAQ